MAKYHLSWVSGLSNIVVKEDRDSFFGLRVEVLKLQSRIKDTLRSPSYYIIISTYDQS